MSDLLTERRQRPTEIGAQGSELNKVLKGVKSQSIYFTSFAMQ